MDRTRKMGRLTTFPLLLRLLMSFNSDVLEAVEVLAARSRSEASEPASEPGQPGCPPPHAPPPRSLAVTCPPHLLVSPPHPDVWRLSDPLELRPC